MGLGVVGIEIVTAGEGAMTAGDPTDMGLLLGVALHVSLQVLLSLEATLATGLFTLELNLFDDGGKVLERKALLGRLLPGNLPGHGTMRTLKSIVIDG